MLRLHALITTLLALVLTGAGSVVLAHGEHAGHVAAPVVVPTNWTEHALLRVAMIRGAVPSMRIHAVGSDFDQMLLQTPEVPTPTILERDRGGWSASKSQMGTGGHLWFMATRETDSEVVRASTYYFFPARHQVPTEMLRSLRGGLEIVPLRLQEHGGTREGSRWRFLLRYGNQPLPNHNLLMETEGGTRQGFTADAEGIVEISIPRDFLSERLSAKEGINARQEFVLSLEHFAEGKRYLTTYNHSYNPDRMRERSLPLGLGVFALGMVLAVPFLRRKEKKHA